MFIPYANKANVKLAHQVTSQDSIEATGNVAESSLVINGKSDLRSAEIKAIRGTVFTHLKPVQEGDFIALMSDETYKHFDTEAWNDL